MQVAADIRARVTAKINECVAKINAAHSTVMPPITVAYDINSTRLGGEAHPSKMHLRFNPMYLNEHTDHYIAQTVPHEVAHLGVHHVRGSANRWVVRGSKVKRDIHGEAWKTMMALLGVPADRCHTYTTPAGVTAGKPKSKYTYTCSVCGALIVLGPKKHAQMQRGARMWHRGCSSGRLVFAASAGKVSYADARAQAAAPTPRGPAPLAPAAPVPATPKRKVTPRAGSSKLDRCYGWYCHYREAPDSPRGSLRQLCIAVFVQEIGMTAAGASTYYNTCQKMYAA
jgi:SprT protein